MGRKLSLSGDPSDLELGKVAAEADRLVVTLTTLELESNAHFAAELLDDLSGHTCAGDGGSTNCGGGTVVDEENLTEFNFFVSSYRKFVDTNSVAFRDAILLTAGFKDCVGHVEWELNYDLK
jgi:hypothetical protein